MIENILDQLIEKNKKVSELLQELKIMVEVEKHDFCIRKIDDFKGMPYYWELIKVSTNELVKLDKIERIQSYLKLRNITSVITI